MNGHAREYYPVFKKTEILPLATMWNDIMLSEIIQMQKDKCHMVSTICRIYNDRTQRKERWLRSAGKKMIWGGFGQGV
jgi:hypothetical protein